MAKIKLDANLYERAKAAAEAAGYSSVDEFVTHLLEKELTRTESPDAEGLVTDRLRGLGDIQ
jgi:hypothetical protein